MILALLLLTAAVAPPPPTPTPATTPPARAGISCNVAVAMFAPRSDALDEKAVQALDRIPAEARSSLEVDGIMMMVLPHPVTLDPVDAARQRSLTEGRGQKIKDYLTAHGYPADRIGIRPADVNPGEEKNWVEGALIMVEGSADAWTKTRLSAIC
jgi:hypothetical protein